MLPTAVIILLIFVASTCVSGNRQKRQYLDYNKQTNSCITIPPDPKQGTCINLKDCPEMFNILKYKRRDAVATKYLTANFCFYEGSNPVVCCPTEVKSATKFPSLDVCGLTDVNHDRVVGGQPSVLGAWPWIAAIGFTTPTKYTPDWLCGGTLINERYVVTAAHCIITDERRVLSHVRLGDLDLDSSIADGATPVEIKVEKTIVHPEYNASRYYTDIGLVKLMEKVTFTKLIKPICLPFADVLKSNNFDGYTPFIAGWGALAYKGRSSTHLQEVQIDVIDLNTCKEAYKRIKTLSIDGRAICAGRSGKDSCQGDSGGPLMLPRGNNFYLIGVVSFGFKCAEPGYPGIYTRLTEFVDWINATVEL